MGHRLPFPWPRRSRLGGEFGHLRPGNARNSVGVPQWALGVCEATMILRLARTLFCFLLFSSCVSAAPVVVQSLVVNFPANGRVIVQAREEIGKFPQMLFISEKTSKVLHHSPIEDEEKMARSRNAVDKITAQPELRFRVIRSYGFRSPMIMSVGVYHGGSDSAFFLTIFGEVGGKIHCFNEKPIFANIQGGYYLGYLNKKFGYGLAAWNFIWGNGMHESHYSNIVTR